MSINTEAGSAATTPRKRGTPKKAKFTEEEDDGEEFSPSKKPALNKVKTGRVTKARSKAIKSYAEDEEEDDDDVVKHENGDQMSFENGGG